MKPDASLHNPDPRYIAGLIDQTGLTQEEVARRLGITPKALRNYKSETMKREIPYATQHALERLASQSKKIWIVSSFVNHEGATPIRAYETEEDAERFAADLNAHHAAHPDPKSADYAAEYEAWKNAAPGGISIFESGFDVSELVLYP